jgi:hypothetical protein
MSTEVQFDENDIVPARKTASEAGATSGIIGLVLKTRIVKTEQQANYALLAFAALCFIVIGFIIKTSVHSAPTPLSTPEQIRNMPQK